MRVTKEDLKIFGLFDSLPDSLKNLGEKEYFVFYYSVIEEEAKLSISSIEVVKEVNISLYRTLRQKNQVAARPLNIGFFSNTFETRDGLFYYFLRTFNLNDNVKAFYSNAVEQDKIVDVNVSTNSISNIYTGEDFRRAISYFCNGRIQTITQIYDMVNNAMKNRLSRSLYGDALKKVVNLVIYDGGVLPEIGGRLRFMVIGEKAVLTDEQKDSLNEAKQMIRSMIPIDKVYMATGWALSQNDGKWRTNIADNEAKLLTDNFVDYEGRKLYVPTGQSIQSILPILKEPTRAIGSGYNGRLIEVLYHPTLYKYYPRLALMPVIYWYGDKEVEQQSFYFSPDERGGFIVINGSKSSGSSLSILLHEIQHSVQRIEDFATGGNLFLAKFVASIGSNSVRKIFACINKIERYYREYLFDDSSRMELQDVLISDNPKNQTARQVRDELLKMLSDSEDYKFMYKTINFYLVIYISEQQDFSMSDVVNFLSSKIPNEEVLYELFQNISDAYKEANRYSEKLLSEGYRKEDISSILFKGYENLYGEMESRSVQISRFVESEFRNYFYLTKWENTPIQQLTVIDGVEEIIDCKNIKAAVESKDGDYVLHFKKEASCVPFLHELGHIVHDCLNRLGHEEEIKEEFENDLFSNDFDEWFVDRFLAYLKSKVYDDNLRKDLQYDIKLTENKKISKMLDDFFAETESGERLKFLQTILSIE